MNNEKSDIQKSLNKNKLNTTPLPKNVMSIQRKSSIKTSLNQIFGRITQKQAARNNLLKHPLFNYKNIPSNISNTRNYNTLYYGNKLKQHQISIKKHLAMQQNLNSNLYKIIHNGANNIKPSFSTMNIKTSKSVTPFHPLLTKRQRKSFIHPPLLALPKHLKYFKKGSLPSINKNIKKIKKKININKTNNLLKRTSNKKHFKSFISNIIIPRHHINNLSQIKPTNMEKLELKNNKLLIKNNINGENWSPCDICGVFNSLIGDIILYCDGCNIAVHKLCYGVDVIPQGDWFCDLCQFIKINRIKKGNIICPLCPIMGTTAHAYKMSEEGRWVHMVCAVYIPEIKFKEEKTYTGLTIKHLDRNRFKLMCDVCKTYNGACLQCTTKDCYTAYHPLCARINKIIMISKYSSKGILSTTLYCKNHDTNNINLIRKRKHVSVQKRTWKPHLRRKPHFHSEWNFTISYLLYPKNTKIEISKSYELIKQTPEIKDDTFYWEIISTTDVFSENAFNINDLLTKYWDENIVGTISYNSQRRPKRKAIGYSCLKTPTKEMIAIANWSFWEVNLEIICMSIKFMVCKSYNRKHVSMRRKNNGTLLAAHLIDLAFSKKKVEWIMVCSEKGYAEKFWNSLGFNKITKRDRSRFSVVNESELNPFRDTILLITTRKSLKEKVGSSYIAHCWNKWRLKHCNKLRRLLIKNNGEKVMEFYLDKY